MGGLGFGAVMGGALLLVALVALGIAVRGLRTGIPRALLLYRAHRVGTATGVRAQGLVTSSVERITTTADGYMRDMAETIRFSTREGGQVTGAPLISDVDTEDRSGWEVTVYYDPEHPDRFVAPHDGSSPDLREDAKRAGTALLSGVIGLVVTGVVLRMALRMLLG